VFAGDRALLAAVDEIENALPPLEALALALEELHRTLVLLGCGSARKSAEVSPATGSRIDFS
jgi:hypothetical protein